MSLLAAAFALLAGAPPEVLYDYEVTTAEHARELSVEARFSEVAPGCLEVGDGAELFVVDPEVKQGDGGGPSYA